MRRIAFFDIDCLYNGFLMTGAGIFRVGAWIVDPGNLPLSDGEQTLRIRPKVMDLLEILVERPCEAWSKHELLDLLWPDVTVGDASLTVAVGELREALGDRAGSPEYIETIPRRGYRLIACVQRSGIDRRITSNSSSGYWLVGSDGQFALKEGTNVIGRAADADVRIPSARVSRHHARITVDDEGAVIEDLNSKNGTFLGDAEVERSTPVSHGDEIRLGTMAAVLRFVALNRDSTITEHPGDNPPKPDPEAQEQKQV